LPKGISPTNAKNWEPQEERKELKIRELGKVKLEEKEEELS